MEFAIAFQGNKAPDEYVALARLVNNYAFDVVSVYNDLLFQPALGPLLWMAPHLDRSKRIGFAALNPYTVHPIEIAGQAALLDLATNGRAYLGLARGAWLNQIGVVQDHPLEWLTETVLAVKHLLRTDPNEFAGSRIHLPAGMGLNYSVLRSQIPIMIGTWGRRTAMMAGCLADEVKIGGSSNPEMVGVIGPAIRAGEKQAARPIGSVGLCFGAVTVVDSDRSAARARVRREAALYLPVTAALDPTLKDEEWLTRLKTAADLKDYDAVSGLISDDILEKFAFSGNPRDIIRQTQSLVEAGATRVEFGTPHGLTISANGIKLLGEQVLPYFRERD